MSRWLAWLLTLVITLNLLEKTYAATQVTFLHWNDQHARVEPADNSGGGCKDLVANNNASLCFGGYARLGTFFKQERADPKNKNVFVLNIGDQFTGTIWDNVYRGSLSPIFQNAMNVDIAILGNHEFDFGGDYLGWVVQKLNCPLLCANLVVTPATPNLTALSDKVQPYAIKTLDDGSKIGFIGWITPDTKFTADVGPYIDFKPVDSSVKLIIEELVSLNITRIVGLSHTGYVEDLQFASVLNGTGIDLILGAHSHSFLANDPYPITLLPKSTDQSLVVGPYPTDLGNGIAPVAQAYYASKYVGKLQTYWDDDGKLLNATGTPVVMGGSSSGNWVKEDPDIQAIVDQYKPPVRLFQRTIIGETLTLLNADKTQIRQQETTMGDATCESMVEFAFRERLSTLTSNPNNPISIAVFNGGAIRASIPVGNITVDNVLAAFPFGNSKSPTGILEDTLHPIKPN